MSDRPHPVSPAPAAKGAGVSLLLNALCSLLISATTCFIFIHYSLVPVAANKSPLASPAPRIKPAASQGTVSAPAAAQSGDLFTQPMVVADAVLQAIPSIMQDKGYIDIQDHATLKTYLTQMQSTAEAILNDDGTNEAASNKRNLALVKLINDSITRTETYLGRSYETGQNRETTQQLHDLLVKLKDQ